MLQPIPAPTEVLHKICDQFLANKTAVLFYMTDSENYGRHTMASQYFLQLAQYVRLPVVSWNADNSAFEQAAGDSRTQVLNYHLCTQLDGCRFNDFRVCPSRCNWRRRSSTKRLRC